MGRKAELTTMQEEEKRQTRSAIRLVEAIQCFTDGYTVVPENNAIISKEDLRSLSPILGRYRNTQHALNTSVRVEPLRLEEIQDALIPLSRDFELLQNKSTAGMSGEESLLEEMQKEKRLQSWGRFKAFVSLLVDEKMTSDFVEQIAQRIYPSDTPLPTIIEGSVRDIASKLKLDRLQEHMSDLHNEGIVSSVINSIVPFTNSAFTERVEVWYDSQYEHVVKNYPDRAKRLAYTILAALEMTSRFLEQGGLIVTTWSQLSRCAKSVCIPLSPDLMQEIKKTGILPFQDPKVIKQDNKYRSVITDTINTAIRTTLGNDSSFHDLFPDLHDVARNEFQLTVVVPNPREWLVGLPVGMKIEETYQHGTFRDRYVTKTNLSARGTTIFLSQGNNFFKDDSPIVTMKQLTESFENYLGAFHPLPHEIAQVYDVVDSKIEHFTWHRYRGTLEKIREVPVLVDSKGNAIIHDYIIEGYQGNYDKLEESTMLSIFLSEIATLHGTIVYPGRDKEDADALYNTWRDRYIRRHRGGKDESS